MQGVIKKMDGTGHTEVAFDTDDPKSMEVAADQFANLKQRNVVAWAIADINGQRKGAPVDGLVKPGEGIALKEFGVEDAEDRKIEPQEYLIAAPMVGG